MRPTPMPCAYCGDVLEWPKDFPLLTYAECARCLEKRSRPGTTARLWARLLSALKL